MKRAARLIPAFGLALLLANLGQAAQAGYFSAGLTTVQGTVDLLDSTSSAGPSTPQADEPAVPASFGVRCEAAVIGQSLNFGPVGGMTMPSPDHPGSGAAAAVLTQHSPDRSPALRWLAKEGRA